MYATFQLLDSKFPVILFFLQSFKLTAIILISLDKLKKNSYLRESHCNLYKPNDIFYITPTKQKLKEDKQFLPISHYKVNPFPKTARKYDFNEGNLWVTDAFLEKMRKAGTLSPETEMKIKSFTLKPPSDNYYLNLMVKDLIELNYKNKESQ